ncbi:MAG: thiamine-phosphate kinase [bacterium]
MKKLRDLGELELVELINKKIEIGTQCSGREMLTLVKASGDDAAVLKISDTTSLLISKDLLIERIHFLKENIIPKQLAQKALAVNISDIAAMGGKPGWVLIGFAGPGDTSLSFITDLYDAFMEVCAFYGLKIIGGDTSSSPGPIVLSITIVGLMSTNKIIYRSGAQEGDRIMVSGILGGARIGLSLLQEMKKHEEHKEKDSMMREVKNRLIQRHYAPTPRVDIGTLLAENELATAMIDVSDGLIQDLGHMCRLSHVGAVIKKNDVPVDPDVITLGDVSGEDPYDAALRGGEDYELLFTVTEEKKSFVQRFIFEKTGNKITDIGYIIPSALNEIKIEDKRGQYCGALYKGFDHFKGK